jgi:YHS domain-containing protein
MDRIDVVCQQSVEESLARASGLTAEHQGHVYFFCSTSCMERFEHEPQKYVGRLDVEYGRPTGEAATG